jgi:hypothetical protein
VTLMTLHVTLVGYSPATFSAAQGVAFRNGLADALGIASDDVAILSISAAPPSPATPAGHRRTLLQAMPPSPPPAPAAASATAASLTLQVVVYAPNPGGLTSEEVIARLVALTPAQLLDYLVAAGLTSATSVSSGGIVFSIPWPSPPPALPPPLPPPPPAPPPVKRLARLAVVVAAVAVPVAVGGMLLLAVGAILLRRYRRRVDSKVHAELPDGGKAQQQYISTPLWTVAEEFAPPPPGETQHAAMPPSCILHTQPRASYNAGSAQQQQQPYGLVCAPYEVMDDANETMYTRLMAIMPPAEIAALPRSFDPRALPDTREAADAALAAVFAPPGATPDEAVAPYVNEWAGTADAIAALYLLNARSAEELEQAGQQTALMAALRPVQRSASVERSRQRSASVERSRPGDGGGILASASAFGPAAQPRQRSQSRGRGADGPTVCWADTEPPPTAQRRNPYAGDVVAGLDRFPRPVMEPLPARPRSRSRSRSRDDDALLRPSGALAAPPGEPRRTPFGGDGLGALSGSVRPPSEPRRRSRSTSRDRGGGDGLGRGSGAVAAAPRRNPFGGGDNLGADTAPLLSEERAQSRGRSRRRSPSRERMVRFTDQL